MTVKDVIRCVEELRPGCSLSFDEYLVQLKNLESEIYSNIISRFENADDYAELTSAEDILAVPDMYACLYTHYLCAQIDVANGDITRYSNNMILYNSVLSSYCDWYTRNHMPLQRGKLRWH